jgi:hypothetical protein
MKQGVSLHGTISAGAEREGAQARSTGTDRMIMSATI